MNKNTLIVVGGFAGAGKTTVARKLAAEFNLPVFSTDDINDGLRLLVQDLDFHTASPLSYEFLWFLLRRHLRNGASAILDTNMCRQISWDNLDKLKSEFPDLLIRPILLKCSIEVHKQRIDLRGVTDKEHFNLGGDALKDVMFKYDFINKLQRDDLVSVNAEANADAVYDKVRDVVLGVAASGLAAVNV